MATKIVYWNDTPGLTLHWFPNSQVLADWETYKVLAVDVLGVGNYSATLSDTVGDDWALFSGASAPSTFGEAIGAYTFPTDSTGGDGSGSGGSGGAIGTLTYTFTSQSEIERLFSSLGLEYRRDDFAEDAEQYAAVLNEVIDQATWEVKAILNKIFEDEDFYTNTWIRRRCTIIACYLLSIRRGNDAQFYQEYLDALVDLQGLVEGDVYLGIPAGKGTRVEMFNVHTDNRFPAVASRVDIYTSTSTAGPKFLQWYRPFYWI